MIYSRIAGTGSYLPRAGPDQRRARAARVDTSDEWIRTRTGIRAAPHRRRRRRPRATSRSRRSRRALEAAGRRAERHRSHHRRDHDARHDLPEHRLPAAGEARRARAAPRSTCRRCAAASSTRSPPPTASSRPGMRKQRARRRRRGLLAHPRLERPRHLRAVRRRRRRGRARGRATSPASRQRACTPTAASADILSRAGQRVRAAQVAGSPFLQMDGQGGVQVRGAGARRSRRARRSPRPACALADIDWLIPHQANIRIIDATAQEARPAARRSSS